MKLFFRKGTKTIPHDPKTGLPLLHSSPRFNEFATYMTTMQLPTCEPRLLPTPSTFEEMISTNTRSIFEYQDCEPKAISDQTELPTLAAETKQGKLIRWHYRLGHLPFLTLQNMAKHRLIDPSLAKIEPPMCAGCSYRQQSQCAWQTKPSKKLRHRHLKPS